jgi:hypothetical protein
MPRHPEVGAASERKRLKKEERVAHVAEIRVAAFARWAGRCALYCKSPATDLHHVLSGPERRAKESVETVLPVCRDHHRTLHRNDLHALEDAYNVCTDNGMHEARRALGRRIDKILGLDAARGSAARAERERSGA